MAEPLVSKSPLTTGAVTISAASLIAALGWMGEKLISLDEDVTTHSKLLEQMINTEDGIVLHERIKGLEVEVTQMNKEQSYIRSLLQSMRDKRD